MIQLRGPRYTIDTELDEIKSILACQEISSEGSFKSRLREMTSRSMFYPVASLLLMFCMQPISGSDTVSFYSLDIFQRANVKMNNHMLSICVNSGFTIGYIISAIIMTRVPRKVQFISSAFFMAVSNATLGFTLQEEARMKQD